MARLKIYAAQTEDVNQGWVWLGGFNFPHRSIAKLSSGNKNVHCEVLAIDVNFLHGYDEPPRIQITEPKSALVAAQWYRTRLGIQTGVDVDIDVTPVNSIYGRIRACLDHPQVVVRLATILGLWGFVLGFIGIVLSIVALFK